MFLSITLLFLVAAQGAFVPRKLVEEHLEARTCGFIIKPRALWSIRQNDPYMSFEYGPSANGTARFETSQGAHATNQSDLVVSFKGVPCPPAGFGPFAVEFLYQPSSQYFYSGQKRIDMFAIKGNGSLPGQRAKHPTWENMTPLMGSLIGTFSLPTDYNITQLININQLICQPEMNLRFSITNDDLAAGYVDYQMIATTGLRIRYGC